MGPQEEEALPDQDRLSVEVGMEQKLSVGLKQRFRLIKWDCDLAPDPMQNPEQDPRCAEIIEWDLNGPKKTIYKRE